MFPIDLSETVSLFDGFGMKNDHIERGFVPEMLDDRRGAAQEFMATILGYNRKLLSAVGESCTPHMFSFLYQHLSRKLSGWYVPTTNRQILSNSMTITFIQLVQAGPTPAAFSSLTMYSIRHRILKDHPDSFDDLFR